MCVNNLAAQVVALITVEVHARDVIEKLIKSGASSPADFEWASQLRFYWDRDSGDITAKQVPARLANCWRLPAGALRCFVCGAACRCRRTGQTPAAGATHGRPLLASPHHSCVAALTPDLLAFAEQVLSVLTYGYEYQGNNGRLVITPLTDR